MAARRNRRGRRRNRGRFSALYKLLSVLIIFAAILMGCVVFFRVSTVEITGDSPYTEEEIRRVSGVEQGDNLFTLNKYQISSRIYTQLPYIGTVNFERKYPDTFVIHVTASVPVAWIESGASRWLMDTDCKLLESGGASLTEGKAQVRGLEAVNPSVGSVLTVPPEQQDKLDQLKGFLAAIQARQMTGSLTSFLDLTSNNEIRFGYGANLTVLFPMNGDFTQKTYYLQQTLWTMDEKGIPRTGTLDLTYDNQEGHLLPKRRHPLRRSSARRPRRRPEHKERTMPMRRQMQNKGELAVMVVCVVVGFLLAAQLRSVKLAGAADATNASRLETLQNLYNEVVDQKDGLADQVKQLQGELELYREQAASGEAGSQALKAELEQLEITAGLTDVEGPGVTIILEDSSQANVTGNEADYLIHDNDLLSVINELRSAGAEAISLNGERILATSEVRCTGAVVTVNGRRYAAPYVVFAIGDPDTLYSALTMRNGVVDVLSQWGITVKVTASDQLLIPKYNGTVEYQYAKPIPADEGGEEAVG